MSNLIVINMLKTFSVVTVLITSIIFTGKCLETAQTCSSGNADDACSVDPGIPGNLQPLGTAAVVHKVDRKDDIASIEFIRNYVFRYSPIALTGSLVSPGLKLWKKDDSLRNLPQGFTTWMRTFQENKPARNFTFSNFMQMLSKKKQTGSVLCDEIPFFLRQDVPFPKFLQCTPIMDQLSNHYLWIAGSDMHRNIERWDKDSLHCVVAGKQIIYLISYLDNRELMPAEYEEVDVRRVDLVKYPGLRQVQYHRAILKPGDCLYIPSKWYQQVNSYGRTIAVGINWHHKFVEVESRDCGKPDPNMTINQISFPDLISTIDYRQDAVLHYFTLYLYQDSSITYKQFESKIKKDRKALSQMTNWTDEFSDITHEFFQLLDVNNDSLFSFADLDMLTPKILVDLRGRLEDRMMDFEDIMRDQQEAVAAQQQLKKSSTSAADDAVKKYMNEYAQSLEDILSQSLDYIAKTGQVPDIKKMVEGKLPSLGLDKKDGLTSEKGFKSDKGSTAEKTTRRKAAREKAKDDMKQQQKEKNQNAGDKKIKDKTEEPKVDDLEFDFSVVEETVEEIIAEDE